MAKKRDQTRTGRSVHSVCSVDTVSQQISARHHQHSRLADLSNVASLHSQSQALYSSCETAVGSGASGSAAVGGVSSLGAGLGGGPGSSAYQSVTSNILENSPIQVVRATVGTVDDTSLPCFTFRMWTLSTVFVVMGAAIAEYNFFRSNSAYFSIYFVQLASYFCGKAMARWLPTRRRKPFSWRFTLNPGKFNMKEHMLIGVAAAAGCTPAYATNVLAIQDLVFTLPLGSLTGIGLVVSSQLIGFSMAWLLFDYVIKPSVMIWPATLVNVSLYNTLHEHKVLTRWFTRMQLFWYAFFAVFLYQWLPRMFMPVLTSMALLCWINPSNNVLRKLGSGYMGLGMGCISLDWSIISGVGPLYTPWWAQCNFFVGLILMLWIITPIVYFTDYWSAMSYPIVSSNLFDSTSQLYDVSKIVNADLSFNITMYESYSPIIMTPYFAITYGTSFMAVIATFVHVALYYGSDIWLIAKTRFSRRDIHTALMRSYPEIPGWWFGILFVICFTMAVFVCITTDIHLPVYALILALVLAAVFTIPMAIIQALSSSQVGLNVLSEVVCGYLLPGNQLGNSVFKCYSYMAMYQCLNLTQAFKLGHYMKVPPRKIFITVIYGTLVGAFVNLQVLDWVLQHNREALFDSNPMSGWSFRNLDLFFSASLLWGAISPKLLFENGSIYHFLPYCFLIGLFLPIPFYVMYRHYPPIWSNRLRRIPWHLINTPLICVGASFVPQAPASFVTSAGIVAFIFAFLVLRFRHEWWRRYTFVLAAALDAGTQICNMAIFVVFSLILKGAVEFPGWLGNDAINPEKCGVGDGYN
ncbi:MAG: OPT oligopeptide transporter protein-domain-containing protein [Linnemannia gamsii]|nr:MAG: OPT oligopeptide transporter protein-domain-containing protein [Linnemannia gamsii]